jgi:hypothetical protein
MSQIGRKPHTMACGDDSTVEAGHRLACGDDSTVEADQAVAWGAH